MGKNMNPGFDIIVKKLGLCNLHLNYMGQANKEGNINAL